MSWGYVAVAGATLVSGYLSSNSAKKGAKGQAAAADAATQEQARQFDQTQANLQPWLDAGGDALALQQRFLGGDETAFSQSPDYAWRLGQGQQALENSASARGNLFGGGAQTDLMNYGQGAASQELNNWWNRLASVSNTGQQTAQSLGNFGQAYGQAFGQNQMNAANARASGYAGNANAWGGAIGQLGGLAGQYFGNQAPSGASAYGSQTGGAGSIYNFGNSVDNFKGWSG